MAGASGARQALSLTLSGRQPPESSRAGRCQLPGRQGGGVPPGGSAQLGERPRGSWRAAGSGGQSLFRLLSSCLWNVKGRDRISKDPPFSLRHHPRSPAPQPPRPPPPPSGLAPAPEPAPPREALPPAGKEDRGRWPFQPPASLPGSDRSQPSSCAPRRKRGWGGEAGPAPERPPGGSAASSPAAP